MPRKPSESAARRDKPQPAVRARAAKSVVIEPSVTGEIASPPRAPEAQASAGQRIADRAYMKWRQRGCPMGDDKRDWFEAEEEVRRETEPA